MSEEEELNITPRDMGIVIKQPSAPKKSKKILEQDNESKWQRLVESWIRKND